MTRNGCVLRVILANNEKIEVEQPGTSGPGKDKERYRASQEYAATRALYQISPELPLYRLFPPFFRDAWISWENADQAIKEDQEAVAVEERQKKIDELIQCLPPRQQTPAADREVNISDQKGAEPAPLSWEETEGEADVVLSKFQKGSPTSLGKKLQEQFRHRQAESPEYQGMQKERTNLPIFAFREKILDTVRKNQITIIQAETGRYVFSRNWDSSPTIYQSTCISLFIVDCFSPSKRENNTVFFVHTRRRAVAGYRRSDFDLMYPASSRSSHFGGGACLTRVSRACSGETSWLSDTLRDPQIRGDATFILYNGSGSQKVD
jgi:hypothetical protein